MRPSTTVFSHYKRDAVRVYLKYWITVKGCSSLTQSHSQLRPRWTGGFAMPTPDLLYDNLEPSRYSSLNRTAFRKRQIFISRSSSSHPLVNSRVVLLISRLWAKTFKTVLKDDLITLVFHIFLQTWFTKRPPDVIRDPIGQGSNTSYGFFSRVLTQEVYLSVYPKSTKMFIGKIELRRP